ncbi:MAG: hypothetical protein ACRCVU_06290, partial [Flavobacterium sp.]
LFVIIGLLLGLGGYFAYTTFGIDNQGGVSDVESVVSTEDNAIEETPGSGRTMKENIEHLIDEANKEKDVDSSVVIATSNDYVTEVTNPMATTNDKTKTENKATAPSVEKSKQPATSERVVKEDKSAKTVTAVESSKRDEKEGEFGYKKYFKVGSTKNEVWASQGDPSDVQTQGDIEVWFYGKSKVRFKNDKVISYSNASGRLNVKN